MKHNNLNMNDFVDRKSELSRLKLFISNRNNKLAIVYGRRRCGKSSLLKKALNETHIYFSADLRDTLLQIEALANTIESVIPGFSKVRYPDWESLFIHLNNSMTQKTVLCIDEFPYLVKNAPELPSVLQKIIDNNKISKLKIILCGSSQQMMQGIALEALSPLYGRSNEVIKVKPMKAGWLKTYLHTGDISAVEEYAIWGGVPRYWEIRKQAASLQEAIKYSVLDRDGVLFSEPERLFIDDMRTSVQSFSILSLIGSGCHRLSEIAARLGNPATQLSRPLQNLIDLEYVIREVPFNENVKNSKKSLYKIPDPFLNFYFAFVVPNRSRLEYGLTKQVWAEIKPKFPRYISAIWENLCRESVPYLKLGNLSFNIPQRWWGAGLNHLPIEIDIVAESTDKSSIMIGEVKWSDKVSVKEVYNKLMLKTQQLPFIKNRKIFYVLFLKHKFNHNKKDCFIITPHEIMDVLV